MEYICFVYFSTIGGGCVIREFLFVTIYVMLSISWFHDVMKVSNSYDLKNDDSEECKIM